MRIEDFVTKVSHARKRTGIILLNPERTGFLSDFEKAGLKIVDLADDYFGNVILSDTSFLRLIADRALGVATCYTNIELHIAPRFEEAHYFKYLIPQLLHSEPLKPIFFVFYSNSLYEKFKNYYCSYQPTHSHFFEEDF